MGRILWWLSDEVNSQLALRVVGFLMVVRVAGFWLAPSVEGFWLVVDGAIS